MKTNLAFAKSTASGMTAEVGLASCDPRFVALLNEAQYELSERGKWWGTYKRLRVCVSANCITWPREVKTVEGFNQCSVSLPIANEWYEFQEDVVAPRASSSTTDGDCRCDRSMMLDRGVTVQFRDISTPSRIRIYPRNSSDAGKKVFLQGLDANGVRVRTLDSGVYVDGEYVTLAYPFATSTTIFAAPGLTGGQKPVTDHELLIFGVAASDSTETQIALWHASEQFPSYRRNYLTDRVSRCSTSGNCEDVGDGCSQVMSSCADAVSDAIVRLEFIPAYVDSDWLFLNYIAIKWMMKAIQMRTKNDLQSAVVYEKMALRVLKSELDAYSPPELTQINVSVGGTAKMNRVFGGFV